MHLNMLHLMNNDETKKGMAILKAISKNKDWENDSIKLLNDANWRGHLAPLISYALSKDKPQVVENALWACVVRGSWVIPQLVAGLALSGSDVVGRSKDIIQNGIIREQKDPIQMHVETGPGDDDSRIGKLLNSLCGLGYEKKLEMKADEILKIRSFDIDGSDQIALNWYRSLVELSECA